MGTSWRARAASRPVWATVAAVAAALMLAGCASSLSPGGPASAPGRSGGSRGSTVIALNNISTLRTLFNREAGHPRLILIFSPT